MKNDWLEKFLQIIEESKVNPSYLEFEITESALIQNEDSFIKSIEMLKRRGIRFSIDDFGTGYSSLLYLKKFSFDTVKIDRSFINGFLLESDSLITKSILYLARGLNMNVIAEGVETIDQLTFLREQGCDQIQGYLFSRPLPEKELRYLLLNPILKPNITNDIEPMKDRRKHGRVSLPFPLLANITLIQIKEKSIKVGKTEVLIEEIGMGGLRFMTHLDLPVSPDIILKFETGILGETVRFPGTVVWKREGEDDFFQYGIQFHAECLEQHSSISAINKLAVQIENNQIPPNCYFVTEEKISYLKNRLTK